MPWCPQRLRGDPSRETDARPSASSLTTRRLNRSAYLLNDTLSAVNWMPGRGSVARERRHNLTRPTSKVSSLHFDSPRAMELPFRERTCQQVKSRVRTCRHPAKVSLDRTSLVRFLPRSGARYGCETRTSGTRTGIRARVRSLTLFDIAARWLPARGSHGFNG